MFWLKGEGGGKGDDQELKDVIYFFGIQSHGNCAPHLHVLCECRESAKKNEGGEIHGSGNTCRPSAMCYLCSSMTIMSLVLSGVLNVRVRSRMDNSGRLLIRKETGLTPAPLKGVKDAKPKDSDSHRVLGNSGVLCESEEPEPNDSHRCFNPTPLSLGGER